MVCFGDALPGPARDAFKRYWTAWLMPDRKAAPLAKQLDQNLIDGTLVHPQIDQLAGGFQSSYGVTDSYYAKTGDWQGNRASTVQATTILCRPKILIIPRRLERC